MNVPIPFLINVVDSFFFISHTNFINISLGNNGIINYSSLKIISSPTYIFKIDNCYFKNIVQFFDNEIDSKVANIFQISDIKAEFIIIDTNFIENKIGI